MPGPLARALQSLRLPLALALLAYLVLRFLISLFRIISGENFSSLGESSFADRISDQTGEYLGLFTLLLLAIAVALVAAVEPLKVARPIVLTTLILTGIGLLLGVFGMLAYFFTRSSDTFNSTRDKVESTLLDLPVIALYALFALFLLALLGAKGLPRAPKRERRPQHGRQYPGAPQQGGIPGFPPVEQQPYGYQQQPQSQAYDPWQGYPQQGGYQQQGYQNTGYQQGYQQQQQQQPYQPEPTYQPPQRPTEQAPWNQPPQQPPYHQPDPPAAPSDATRPVDISKHEDEHAAPPPPAWPHQPPAHQPPPQDDGPRL